MPKKYEASIKSPHKDHDVTLMEEAVKEVLSGKISIRKASMKYKIPKSTLSDKCLGKSEIGCKRGPTSLRELIADREKIKKPKKITMSGGSVVPPLTTHVLDTARGMPAGNMDMELSMLDKGGNWQVVETSSTNPDGRGGFMSSTGPVAGKWTNATYKLRFETDRYFSSIGTKGFYPYVEVVFRIEDPTQHYHVPLLLSPYGYSTYRGS
ncbi:hypothetical protein FSP39_019281 [Pinctada imbricata]|uniref:hydroxyisourate hydrolase n=1 Tax=Pinctada imbricata TaxID=66713 RepID=A0AA89C481_PINIB|nr:hypothetical protein FSP39_019281 [Pinctada imbricata]